jgi:nucleotide-binding universal stress UspA family protein
MTTVIVATDGSDLAIEAALAGLSVTKRADKLLVVSAVDLVDPLADATGHAGPTMTLEQAEASHREAKAEGQAAVKATVEALQDIGYAPEQIETLLVEGDAGPALCRLAADVGALALLVGSRGRGGFKRAFLGSVSDYIVRNAPCSVVVSRSRAPDGLSG